MLICSFCGEELPAGTGKMYVQNDCKVFYFCSSKCEKNTFKLKRKPRTTEWTKEYASLKKKVKK
ncbi:MAG: 50S ribosomal protein L24e [Candidatus Woesearchaeota archaeon]|nr:50S ribosomal protein L24e [Candidatus Woesearchaeota archaeon]